MTEPSWIALTVVHVAATWFLVGLIWTIHVVHYPSFSAIDRDRYPAFQASHMHKMGALVGPPWLIEGITVIAVFALAPTTGLRLLAVAGGLLEAVIIAVTILSSIPAHDRLSTGWNDDAHRSLLRGDRIRVISWTTRGILAALIAAWPALV